MVRGRTRADGAERSARRRRRAASADDEEDAFVTCVVSGEQIPRAEAVLVPLGPGQRVWMRASYTRERDRPEE